MRQLSRVTPTTVLCVDDDTVLADVLRYALSREGYTVQLAHTGAAALQAVEQDLPRVAIVDVNLPDMDGFTLCAHFRYKLGIPVLMLTGRNLEEDVLTGFGQGADDYIVKPFSMQILVVRLQKVLDRVQGNEPQTSASRRIYRVGRGLFDVERNQLIVDGTQFRLTRTEGKILHLLVVNEGQVFSAERMIERLWGYDSESNASVVKTHIRNLRARLAEALGPTQLIRTVPGLGYTFDQAVEPHPRPSRE